MTGRHEVQVVDCDDACPSLPIVEGEGLARAVIWPGIGARSRAMHLIRLAEGARTVPMSHPMEAVYYVISGTVVATDQTDRSTHRAKDGSMIFVEPSTTYVLLADRGAAEIVGGPCPPDPAAYEPLNQ
jgi:quercetin dioxygenase-like cupin family protein